SRGGNFHREDVVSLTRKIRRSRHVYLPPVVHSFRAVLAAGSVDAHRLPIHLAAAVAVSCSRLRRARSAGGHLAGPHAAFSSASRNLSTLRTVRHGHY